MKTIAAALGLIALLAGPAFAQSPYAGMQTRPIKALSKQQIADLQEGRGMSLAMAAELNGYPGPAHVLELADKLELTPEQRSQVQRLFDSMKRDALPLGATLIEQEAELDRQFADHKVTPESLKTVTAKISDTQGALREHHLKYHLTMMGLLSPVQVKRYSELRGYGDHAMPPMHRHN
jgi:Spy/CpxP family protein refolding chaperone